MGWADGFGLTDIACRSINFLLMKTPLVRRFDPGTASTSFITPQPDQTAGLFGVGKDCCKKETVYKFYYIRDGYFLDAKSLGGFIA